MSGGGVEYLYRHDLELLEVFSLTDPSFPSYSSYQHCIHSIMIDCIHLPQTNHPLSKKPPPIYHPSSMTHPYTTSMITHLFFILPSAVIYSFIIHHPPIQKSSTYPSFIQKTFLDRKLMFKNCNGTF